MNISSDTPMLRRCSTCPASRRKQMTGLASSGLYRRCRSEGCEYSYLPPTNLGRSTSSITASTLIEKGKDSNFPLPNETERDSNFSFRRSGTKKVRFAGPPSARVALRMNPSARSRQASWNLTDDSMRHVPANYQILMPAANFIGMPANVVAERMVAFLRINSIQARFDDAKAEVHATTQDYVEFEARLWKNVGGNEGEDSGVILEVQRLGGSSPDFHRLCRDMFRAVRSGAVGESVSLSKEMNNLGAVAEPSATDEGENNDIEDETMLVVIAEMIECDFIETNELGMQSLHFLVRPESAGKSRASKVARTILAGETDLGATIRSNLFSTLNCANGNCRSGAEGANHRVRGEALQILTAMLETAGRHEATTADKQKLSDILLLWERLIPVLLSDLDNAESCPNDAFLAERCLHNLMRISHRAKATAIRCGILPMLADAHDYGQANYLSLETESLKLISMLAGVA